MPKRLAVWPLDDELVNAVVFAIEALLRITFEGGALIFVILQV